MNCRNLLLSSVASIIAAAFFFTGTTALFAEEPPLEPGGKVTVRIEDGTRVKGIVTGEDENFLILVTPAGVEVKIPKTAIVSRREAGELRPDPNYSRLMFAPTGRPLKKGEGYFSDYWVLFPGVAYGVTEHFSILAGFSVLPGVSLDEQAGYIAPRLGKCFTERFAASVGTMFASFGGELTAGIAFATATWGPLDRCLTAGLGIDYSRRRGEKFKFAEQPILLIGGNYRISDSISLVSENWLLPGGDVRLDQYPFGLVARFFGERIAVDAGFILAGEILKEGFPMPWLSFIYNFG